MQAARLWLLRTLVLCVLGAVFLLYTRPDFLVALTDRLWACF